MQNKFIFNTSKSFLYVCAALLVFSLSQFMSGCGGSDEEEIVDHRGNDSIAMYTNLQKAFAMYKKALSQNETSDDKSAAESFESALRHLNDIDPLIIHNSEYYFWKQDYDELARSIVEDYLITQSEISQNSLVFEFAGKVPVTYEKVEQYTVGREPLPDGKDVPLVRNSAVDGYIEFFSNTDRGRSFVDKCLYRSGRYFPLMRKILKYNNMPEELIYLSVQESGLNPTIVSRAGAVGLWQFMPATGYSYGLGQDGYRDDRRDFEKATDAAAHLLRDLYKTYDDWYLAFAAYNAGPGRVNSAIKKSGSRDFWTLRGYLPGETKNYVPSILALSFVLRNPEEYGFKDIEYSDPISFDVVEIKSEISLQRVAELCETDIETIRELNTELTNDQVPLYDVAYELRIPYKAYDKFAANFKKASDIDQSFQPQFAGNEVPQSGSDLASVNYKVKNYSPENPRAIASTSGKMKVSYDYTRTKPLSSVAVYFDIRPVEIRIWNNLPYGSIPKQDQKLEIYLTEDKYKVLFGKNETAPQNELTEVKKEEKVIEEKIEKTEPSWTTKSPVTTTENNSVSTETTTAPEVNTAEVVTETATGEETVEEEIAEEEVVEEKVAPKENTVKTNTVTKTGSKVYTVKEGDNLTAIAAAHGISVAELKDWNGLDEDKILVGQKLKVADTGSDTKNKGNTKTSGVKKTYKVKKGDTLASIADDNDVSMKDLISWNSLESDKILIGQTLKLYPEEKKTKVRKKKK